MLAIVQKLTQQEHQQTFFGRRAKIKVDFNAMSKINNLKFKYGLTGRIGRLVSNSVLCVILASCTNSQMFPNTKKILPELVVPHSIPDVPDVDILKVSKSYFNRKDYPKALLYYEKALILYPDDKNVLLAYAAASDMSGKFKLSYHAYRKYAKKFGEDPEYYNNVGYSMLLQGKYKLARKYLLEAWRFDPSSLVVNNNLKLLTQVEAND